ncbi:MAG: amidohydrolase family protein, partial [Actinobacteria bacterium]|nr:amidohydrolase family protein [Actinomycetota bacterium]
MTVQLIRAQYVLGHDGTDHVLHRDAVVVHSGGVVRYVGTEWPEPVDDVIDLGPALLMPGLIDLDAVADIDHALLDSWSPDSIRSGYQWSEEYARHRRRAVFDADERATIREYALTHLLLNGITTCMPIAAETHSDWAETHDDMVRVAAIAQRLGIRSYLGPSYRSGVTVVRADGHRDVVWEPTLGEDGLGGAVDFLDHVAALGDDRLRGVLLPCRIETMTPQLLAATAAAADDRGVLVRLHAMQGGLEHELLGQRLGYGPLELLERSGLLHERLLVPHATFPAGPVAGVPAEAAVRRRLGAAGVTVVHCPLTAARYGMALRSFDRFREDGVNLALGTDSAPPDLIR